MTEGALCLLEHPHHHRYTSYSAAGAAALCRALAFAAEAPRVQGGPLINLVSPLCPGGPGQRGGALRLGAREKTAESLRSGRAPSPRMADDEPDWKKLGGGASSVSAVSLTVPASPAPLPRQAAC